MWNFLQEQEPQLEDKEKYEYYYRDYFYKKGSIYY